MHDGPEWPRSLPWVLPNPAGDEVGPFRRATVRLRLSPIFRLPQLEFADARLWVFNLHFCARVPAGVESTPSPPFVTIT
jgi:hypothetical protein